MRRAYQIDELKLLHAQMELAKGGPQQKFGRGPEFYFENLRKAGRSQALENELEKGLEILQACGLRPTRSLSRDEVRACCQMREFPGMVGFALIMAWGGQRMDHFRLAGSNASLPRLIADLRSCSGKRALDYEKAMKTGISGLGVSFMTKLLFFFRPRADAYILDQWIARSLQMICVPCPVRLAPWGGPQADTTADEYEQACQAIEEIGLLLGGLTKPLSGEATELLLFSSPAGSWRQHVLKADLGTEANHAGTPRDGIVDRSGCPFCLLASGVIGRHEREVRGKILLPTMSPPTIHHQCSGSTPCRVYCGKDRGIEFYYHINKRSIRVGAFIPSSEVTRHHGLWERGLSLKAHFWDRIEFSGKEKTIALSIRLVGGIHSEDTQREALIGNAVAAMSELFQRIQEVLSATPG